MAQGDGVRGHSDRVWIRRSPVLPAPDLDAVRSPRPSTVPILLFLHSLIATPGRKELKNEEEDTERGARWVFNLFHRIGCFDVCCIFLSFYDLSNSNWLL